MISEVSRRYAKAIYEIAKETNSINKTYEDMQAIEKAVMSEDIHFFITSPVVPTDIKSNAFKSAMAGTNEMLRNLVQVLVEKNRVNHFSEIVAAYCELADSAQGKTRGTVRSASVLNDDEKRQIEGAIKKVTNKEVVLTFSEDKSLLGGLVAQVGGWTFNDTIEAHLIRIKEDLHRRSN